MRVKAWLGAACGLLALGACATRPEPKPAPPRPQPVRPAPPPRAMPAAPDWRDLPLTPGDWVYSRDSSGGSQASFGSANSEASFVLRCDAAARQVTLSREGAGAALHIRTSTSERTLPATARTEPLAYLSAALPASDRLLDEMVFSRGRFTVETEGLARLVIPAWAEPARVVEDCRG